MIRRHRKFKRPILRIVQHLAFWSISFISFLQIFKTGGSPEKIDYIYTALFQLSLLPAVYINLEILLPKIGTRRNVFYYFLSIISVICVFSWVNYEFFSNWSSKVFPDYFFISYFPFTEITLFFVTYLAITTLLKLSKSWFFVSELQRELLEKEKQKAEVELKALKAQINPHFFFNTLNSIYSMALDKDERLPSAILQLSNLMRYFLYESRDNFVPLEKELSVVENYIALQRLRSGDKLSIEVTKKGNSNGQKIAPLLLITFLENAFKHGAKGSFGSTYINLYINIEESSLNFTLENNKGFSDELNVEDANGLGLENVKRQLELLYPGNHSLIINELHGSFVVELQLSL